MPSPNEETRRKCMLIKGRFIGDPSHEYEHSEKTPDDDEGKDEESAVVSFYLDFYTWYEVEVFCSGGIDCFF